MKFTAFAVREGPNDLFFLGGSGSAGRKYVRGASLSPLSLVPAARVFLECVGKGGTTNSPLLSSLSSGEGEGLEFVCSIFSARVCRDGYLYFVLLELGDGVGGGGIGLGVTN